MLVQWVLKTQVLWCIIRAMSINIQIQDKSAIKENVQINLWLWLNYFFIHLRRKYLNGTVTPRPSTMPELNQSRNITTRVSEELTVAIELQTSIYWHWTCTFRCFHTFWDSLICRICISMNLKMYEWLILHINESQNVWMADSAYQWISKCMNGRFCISMNLKMYEWQILHFNESQNVWMADSAYQWISKCMNGRFCISMNLKMYEWQILHFNESQNVWMADSAYQWISKCMNGRFCISMNLKMYEWLILHFNESQNVWMADSAYQWISKCMKTSGEKIIFLKIPERI